MKRFLITAVLAISAFSLSISQSNNEEIEYFQSIFGSEKKSIVSAFINLEGESKDAFWTLYDEYETERKELGKKRVAMLEKYAEIYDGMTDEQADETIAAAMKQMKSLNKLIDSYYKKVRKASGSTAAAQFFHLEHFFLSAIRVSILDSIPLIGEMGE
jgi:Skp family chaperone for outer membrane proteins